MAEAEETQRSNKTASLMISYSRKDKDFIKQLYDGLVAQGFSPDDIWVDWEGIPLSADWMAEITKGIQSTNAFIFVISPDSVASEICQREIDIAVESNKRFIPIMYREPGKDAKLHEKISSHNWVFIRDEDELEKTMPALVEAINTDLDWLAQHTRLYNRAKEWQDKGRNDSYLVRGNDLQDAEAFISEGAAGKDPAPTALHAEYVKAAQNYAAAVRRRNRIITAVVGVVLFVLAVFASIQAVRATRNERAAVDNLNVAYTQQVRAEIGEAEAVSQRATAQANEMIAKENERAANSLALASEALNQKNSDTQLALMLGLLSIQETKQDGIVLPESKSALFSVLNSPNVFYTWQDDAIVSAAAYDPTGKYIAIGNVNGMGQLIDVDSRQLVYRIEMTSSINSLSFSPDGTRLAIATDDTAEVWDVDSGSQLFSLAGHDGYSVHSIDYSPDGNWIATGGADWNVKIWNAGNGSIKVTLP
ncbi:MAG TPA: TIR domain-containing protein, partial [Anaerolineales bacterium]|nr:TIR domain-containing protein [Anaerolineales bacterium]